MPAERRFAAVAFPSVRAGIHAIRRALQAGHRPSVVRMYDEDATRLAFAPGGRRGPARRLHGARLRGRGRGRGGGGAPHTRNRGARPAASCWTRHLDSAGGTGATTSTTRRISPSCPRSGARSTWWPRTRASRRSTRRFTPGGARAVRGRRARAADALLALVPVGHDDLRPLRGPRRRARTRSSCTTGSGKTE